MINEERLDRRAHWIQAAIIGICMAVGWCCRLEFTVQSLKADADKRSDAVERNRANRDKDLLEMTERIRTNEVDIDWLKELRRKQ